MKFFDHQMKIAIRNSILALIYGLLFMLAAHAAPPKQKHAPKPCTMEILTNDKDITQLTCADPPKKQPHWYKDKNWLLGEAIITAAIVADAYSTSSRPPSLIESNPILGRNPSNRSVALFSLGYWTAQSSLHAAAWHVTHHVPLADGSGYAEDRLGWRITGYVAVPAVVAIINGHNAARNYEIR